MRTQQTMPAASVANAHSLLGENKIAQALEMAQILTRDKPDDPAAWAVFASIMLTAREPAAAIVTIERAIRLDPDNANWHILAARALVMAGDLKRGESSLQKAVTLNAGEDAGVLCDAGYVFTLLQKHDTANELFQQASRRQPENAITHFNLGMNLLYLGNFKAAEASLEKSIELDQSPYLCKFEAMLSLADLRKQTAGNNHVADLKSELENPLPAHRESVICFALAKELEDLEQFQESFKFRKRGADLRSQSIKYDVSNDITGFDEVINTHTHEALGAIKPGSEDSSPIFVIGLPRSGTTLTDRVISSHTDVRSAGEPHSFAAELVKLCKGQGTGKGIMPTALQLDMKALAEAYIHNIRQLVPDSPRFIDKLPLNFHYCGLISKALPRAKIIHLKRDPMDACYAIYKALFKNAYPFSYDLDTLAAYYVGYRKLMAHWQETLGDGILHVHYEHLVTDPEPESKRIFEHLELDWQPGVLEFHKHGGASTTASAVQVRSPFSRSSMGKWKNYEAELASLYKHLENAGVLDW